MSPDEHTPKDAPVEDASVEQIHAAEPHDGPGASPTAPVPGSSAPVVADTRPAPSTTAAGGPGPIAPGAVGDVADPSSITDPEELRAQIEETRDGLGDTVEALTYKLDVKARAKDEIDDRKQHAKDTVQQAKETLAETAGRAQAKVSEVASTAQAKVADATSIAHGTAAGPASAAQERAANTATGARESAGQAPQKVRENPIPLAALVVAGVLVVVVLRRRAR